MECGSGCYPESPEKKNREKSRAETRTLAHLPTPPPYLLTVLIFFLFLRWFCHLEFWPFRATHWTAGMSCNQRALLFVSWKRQ